MNSNSRQCLFVAAASVDASNSSGAVGGNPVRDLDGHRHDLTRPCRPCCAHGGRSHPGTREGKLDGPGPKAPTSRRSVDKPAELRRRDQVVRAATIWSSTLRVLTPWTWTSHITTYRAWSIRRRGPRVWTGKP